MTRRVVITGLGCVTPLGSVPDDVWRRLTAGHSAVRPITLFDASNFPVQIAAEVDDSDRGDLSELNLPQDVSRQTSFAVESALNAARDACLTSAQLDPSSVGVYLGCGEVYPDFGRFADLLGKSMDGGGFEMRRFMDGQYADPELCAEFAREPDEPLGHITRMLGVHGPCMNYTTACVSSSVAIGEAMEAIRLGRADVILAGGAHSMIHPFGLSGFYHLSTLSTRDDPRTASRPFDRDRDGFVVGEGAAVVVLEELEHARQRGAKILGELRGYGSTHDAFRLTDPRLDGTMAAHCMGLALQQAQVEFDDLGYINAHGSGTVLNDKIETVALKEAGGKAAYRTPTSSTKAMFGHLTTACGAVEFLTCILALQHQVAPPTINYETLDPECDLDYVPNEARQIRCQHVMNNNFGFGGNNVSLVVSKFDG